VPCTAEDLSEKMHTFPVRLLSMFSFLKKNLIFQFQITGSTNDGDVRNERETRRGGPHEPASQIEKKN
jgi:hypothetical protein